MGCWNKTCGFSNLYITAGMPVYMFVIYSQEDDSERCYTNAFWNPELNPIECEYNDYGDGENFQGDQFDKLLLQLKERIIEMPVGENSSHDRAVSKEGFGQAQFFQAVRDSRLFIGGNYKKDSKVDFVMFRKDVIDHMLENYQFTLYRSGKYESYTFADVMADVPDMLDRLHAEICQIPNHIMEAKWRITWSNHRSIFPWDGANKAAPFFDRPIHSYGAVTNAMEEVVEHLVNWRRAEADAVARSYIKASCINALMSRTRKQWMPAGHEGSQDQGHKGYRALINAMSAALDADKAQWDIDSGGEYDPD